MDDDGKQGFVAEHDGGTAAVLAASVLAQPGADIACLDILSGCCDIADLLGQTEITVDFIGISVELVGEELQVAADVLASLVMLHIIMVEVPVEVGLAFMLQGSEEALLDFLQQVEADEEVVFVRKGGLRAGYQTIEGTLVGQTLGSQTLVEIVVNVGKVTPQTQETLLEFAVVVVGEIAEEPLYGYTLLVSEVRDVVELMDVAQVGKDTVCVGQVLVDVVEVGKQQLSPAEETVEGLAGARL